MYYISISGPLVQQPADSSGTAGRGGGHRRPLFPCQAPILRALAGPGATPGFEPRASIQNANIVYNCVIIICIILDERTSDRMEWDLSWLPVRFSRLSRIWTRPAGLTRIWPASRDALV
jgi:hypothetical protein